MKSGFNINRIEGDGYLVLPLSMSRLADGNGQDPKWCYEVLHYFSRKITNHSVDVIFLYTYGLYSNTEEQGFEQRKKLNQQALNHVSALRNLVEKGGDFIPKAIHYLPFEYVVLNTPHFSDYLENLKKLERESETFRTILKDNLGEREYNEANINFLIEETVVAHSIRHQLVDLPKTLVTRDVWRLLIYPGSIIGVDAYQTQQNILPSSNTTNPYAFGQYNYDTKTYADYHIDT